MYVNLNKNSRFFVDFVDWLAQYYLLFKPAFTDPSADYHTIFQIYSWLL